MKDAKIKTWTRGARREEMSCYDGCDFYQPPLTCLFTGEGIDDPEEPDCPLENRDEDPRNWGYDGDCY